jgi:hypothetical protein
MKSGFVCQPVFMKHGRSSDGVHVTLLSAFNLVNLEAEALKIGAFETSPGTQSGDLENGSKFLD